MFTTFPIELALERAKSIGLNHIRCSLTGQITATLDDSVILKAIEYEVYSSFDSTVESVMDTLQTRWFIQSSRPAPHLTNHNTPHGMRFLRMYYPRDLFAILASKLVFENMVAIRFHSSTELAKQKLQWLVEFQDLELDDNGIKMVNEMLIRLDAIHGIRHVLYSDKVREMALAIRENEFDFDSLCSFIDRVENEGLEKLAKMKNPPATANRLALSAALQSMTPEQLVVMEEAEFKNAQSKRAAYTSESARNGAKSGKVAVRHGFGVLVELRSILGTLKPELEEKYKAEVQARVEAGKSVPKGAGKPNQNAAPKSKAVLKAAARFGDIGW